MLLPPASASPYPASCLPMWCPGASYPGTWRRCSRCTCRHRAAAPPAQAAAHKPRHSVCMRGFTGSRSDAQRPPHGRHPDSAPSTSPHSNCRHAMCIGPHHPAVTCTESGTQHKRRASERRGATAVQATGLALDGGCGWRARPPPFMCGPCGALARLKCYPVTVTLPTPAHHLFSDLSAQRPAAAVRIPIYKVFRSHFTGFALHSDECGSSWRRRPAWLAALVVFKKSTY